MKELHANIFSSRVMDDADALCVLTNGALDMQGNLVMGAGIALEFAKRYPHLPKILGKALIAASQNRVRIIEMIRKEKGVGKIALINFPTKNHWRDPSSLPLIIESAKSLMMIVEGAGFRNVYTGAPGCGLGGLSWEDEVKLALDSIFDDRITILFKPKRTQLGFSSGG